MPDVCLPSNYTNWRPLNPSNALASTTTCFIGRSTADSVDRLFCYGANTFCDLGIGTNSPQGDSNATCYDNTQVSIGSERVVLGASASETLCYVDSNSLSTIRCQGFNSEFKMNLGGSNESFSQGCDESSMAEGTFNVTTTGLDSYYFMQALDMYPLSGATLTYPVLPLTLSGYNVTSEQTSASSSFNIMCSTDWPCQAWPIVSSSVGTIASYSLQDTCDSILGSNCIFNSSSGYLDCRFWSDLAPTCFPLYYMGAGILGETTLCIESVSGVSYTTGTTGNLCTHLVYVISYVVSNFSCVPDFRHHGHHGRAADGAARAVSSLCVHVRCNLWWSHCVCVCRGAGHCYPLEARSEQQDQQVQAFVAESVIE